MVIWLPKQILFLGLIWLLGVAVYLAGQNAWFKKNGGNLGFLVATGLLALGSLVLTKSSLNFDMDYVVGIAFTLFIACLSVQNFESVTFAKVATTLGETTYTLYLTHFPLLVLIFFVGFKGQKMQPGLMGGLWFLGLLVVVLSFTTLVWWGFERNTDRIRKWLETRLIQSPH